MIAVRGGGQGIFHRELTLPRAAEAETVVGAPPYIIAGWAGVAGDRLMQGVTGLWNHKVAPLAHFVGCPDKAGGLTSLAVGSHLKAQIPQRFKQGTEINTSIRSELR